MASEPSEILKLVVKPHSERFDPNDDRWLDHVTDLVRDLRDGTGALEIEPPPQPGAKGAAEALILALGTAGAFTSAVEIVKAWLTRDRSRTVEVSWNDDHGSGSFVIHGDAIDDATLGTMATVLAARFQERP
jgi:hypothetical protein